MRILNLSCPVVLKMCYEFRVFITDDLWPLWKVNLKHERKCELLESVDESSEVLWCCVSWCWCCIGRGKSISVFVSQCPGGGSQGYERDLLVDLRLLWPPANCTDISRIFSDKLGSVKLISFRKRIILSCSLFMRCRFLCQVHTSKSLNCSSCLISLLAACSGNVRMGGLCILSWLLVLSVLESE